MKKLIFSISLLCLWADPSGAVSRVGGGKVRSQSSGFEMQTPQYFAQLKDIGTQAVRAEGPAVYISGRGVTNQFVDITEFRSDFPDLVSMNRAEIRQRLEASRWQELPASQGCVLVMKNANPQIAAVIATWGNGKGFVLKGRNLPDVNTAMQEMLTTLSIEPGSCAWN